MKNTLKLIVIVCTLFSLNSFSQESFPKSWVGKYNGELEIFGVDSIKMKLKMKLDIFQKTDSVYLWKMTYVFRGKEDIRDYELIVVDKKKGIYKIDEKNSIVINSYLKSNILTSFFEVSKSFIISTYTKVNNTIEFEIISGDGKNPVISGNSNVNNEDIPEVKSYFVNGRQKAILKKN